MVPALSSELIQALLQSDKPFPVDFEQAWQWSAYPTRRGALSKLTSNFLEGTHYISSQLPNGKYEGGRLKTVFWLSNECLKSFVLMAGTQKGRELNVELIKAETFLKKASCQEWSDTITKITLAICLLSPFLNRLPGQRAHYWKILTTEYDRAIALFFESGAVTPKNLQPFLDLKIELKRLVS